MWEVYKITHRATGKTYIGVTTMTLSRRIIAHKSRKTAIGQAMLDDGDDAFSVSTICRRDNKPDALAAESDAIWKYGTHEPEGFNRRARGGKYPGCGGCPGNRNSRRRPCVAYHPDGREAHRFETVMGASKALGIERSAITRALNNPRAKSGGYHWKKD